MENHFEIQGAILYKVLQASHPHPDSLDAPDGIKWAHSVKIFRKKTEFVLSEMIFTRLPKNWVVVAEEVPVLPLGYMVEVPNIAIVKLTRTQTFQEASLIHEMRGSSLYA